MTFNLLKNKGYFFACFLSEYVGRYVWAHSVCAGQAKNYVITIGKYTKKNLQLVIRIKYDSINNGAVGWFDDLAGQHLNTDAYCGCDRQLILF